MVSISNLTLPQFQSFTLENSNTISTRWEKYKKHFANLIIALNVEDETQKKILLLDYIGEYACGVCDNHSVPGTEETYARVIESLDQHFAPRNNINYDRCFFCNAKQNTD